ncbi:MAG: hypothetical protein WCS94_01510, partial [Verrucomicrobiota bacterium]
RLKKPFIYAGFNNSNTDGHGWTRMKMDFKSFTHWAKRSQSSHVFILETAIELNREPRQPREREG